MFVVQRRVSDDHVVRNHDASLAHLQCRGELGVFVVVTSRARAYGHVIFTQSHVVDDLTSGIHAIDDHFLVFLVETVADRHAHHACLGVKVLNQLHDLACHQGTGAFQRIERHIDLDQAGCLHLVERNTRYLAGRRVYQAVDASNTGNVGLRFHGQAVKPGGYLVRLDLLRRHSRTTLNGHYQASLSAALFQLLSGHVEQRAFLVNPAGVGRGIHDVQHLAFHLVELLLRRQQLTYDA